MDSAGNQIIFVLAQQNLNLNQENIALKSEIVKLKETITKQSAIQCCGKTGKGVNCQIESKINIDGKWYCWRHHHRLMEFAFSTKNFR